MVRSAGNFAEVCPSLRWSGLAVWRRDVWNILEGEGRQCAQHRGLWRDPAPSTLLEIQLETNSSGKYRWVILDQGRMLNLLPFISVSLKIKKKQQLLILLLTWIFTWKPVNKFDEYSGEFKLNSWIELCSVGADDWLGWVIRKVYSKVPWLIE